MNDLWVISFVCPYLLFTVQKGMIFVVMERVIEAVYPKVFFRQLQVLVERNKWGVTAKQENTAHLAVIYPSQLIALQFNS